MKVSRKSMLLVLVAVVGLAFAPRPASADAIGYFISDPNAALVGYPAPYALVLVNRTSATTANITFLSDSASGYWFGGAQSADVNSNGVTTVSNIASTGCRVPGNCGAVSDGGANNVSTFGNFNHTLDTFDGWPSVSSQISFTLTLTVGTWATAGQVLVNNASNYLAAAHIFVGAPGDTSQTSSALATGFAGNGLTTTQTCFGCTTVPDGGMTISMLGMAMAGIGLVARRVVKK